MYSDALTFGLFPVVDYRYEGDEGRSGAATLLVGSTHALLSKRRKMRLSLYDYLPTILKGCPAD